MNIDRRRRKELSFALRLEQISACRRTSVAQF
jgi:hypothetical protein